MDQLVLFDTDVLIDAGRKVVEAVTCLERAEQKVVLGISMITQMELIVGCRNKTDLRIPERFLRRFEVVSVDDSISHTAVALLRRYRLNHSLLIADALIAATALTIEAPLVTKNQRDYRFIKVLKVFPYPQAFI